MNDDYYILIDGEPKAVADIVEWSRWFRASDDSRRIDRTIIEAGVEISTVFLGMDHAFGGPVPILWETLVFGGPLDGYGERYASRDKAVLGHARWCDAARKVAPAKTEDP